MKKNLTIFTITSFITLLIIYILYVWTYSTPRPISQPIYFETSTDGITQSFKVTTLPATSTYATMDSTPSNYKCIKLHRLDNNELTFCVRKKPLVLKNDYNVRGMYVVDTDTIYLDKNSPTDRILHELFHSCSHYQYGKLDEESKAYQFQYFYLQLLNQGYVR